MRGTFQKMLLHTRRTLLLALMSLNMTPFVVRARELPPLFKTIPRADSVISEARSLIKTRIRGLFNTYSYDLTENESDIGFETSIYFHSQLEMKCASREIPKQGLVATIHYSMERGDGVLRETFTYIGCSPDEGMVEVIETRGRDLKGIPKDQLVRSLSVDTRSFELKENETRRFYGLYDLQNVEIFTTLIEKPSELNESAQFYVRTIDFLSMALERDASEDNIRWRCSLSPITFTDKKESGSHGPRHYRLWRPERVSGRSMEELQVEYQKRPSEHLTFLSSKSTSPISENAFQKEFTESILNLTMSEVAAMVEYIIYTFPSVEEKGVSKLKSARLIQELQNQVRLIERRTNLDAVVDYLRSLINAIDSETILIEDRRQKER